MLDVIYAVAAVTLLIAAGSFWVRRHTLARPLEAHATLAVLFASAGTFLALPTYEAYLGKTLHLVFGPWELDTLLGFYCWLIAGALVLEHTVNRLHDGDFARTVTGLVGPVLTIAMPLMTFAWFMSPVLDRPSPPNDLIFTFHGDVWLTVIKATMVVAMILFLGASIAGLIFLRADPRARAIVDLQIVACSLAVCAYLKLLTEPFVGKLDAISFWCAGCASIAIYSLAAAASWRAKVRDMAARES